MKKTVTKDAQTGRLLQDAAHFHASRELKSFWVGAICGCLAMNRLLFFMKKETTNNRHKKEVCVFASCMRHVYFVSLSVCAA